MRLTYGVGINDADYKTQDIKAGWFCPFFLTWRNMLRRVYHPAFIKQRPSYAGVSVCEEWKRFSNFRSWMECQDWSGKQLDKDLLKPGNKHYSPENCCFISHALNTFLVDRGRFRGDYPLGVHLRKETGKFVAQISEKGQTKFIGAYDSPEKAHAAWLSAKKIFARAYAEKEQDARIAAAVVDRYEREGYLK